MSGINDGGPAFPREDYQTNSASGQSGMTLRDYFAAKAMAALIDEPRWAENQIPAVDRLAGVKGRLSENYAKAAYAMADAMLAAREAR